MLGQQDHRRAGQVLAPLHARAHAADDARRLDRPDVDDASVVLVAHVGHHRAIAVEKPVEIDIEHRRVDGLRIEQRQSLIDTGGRADNGVT